jgi:nitroreductase
MDVFEVINTTRAMRRLKPDPVPDELVWKVLDAAIRAPSGGNRQPWNFIVIRDDDTKKKIAEWYREAWNASYGPARDAMAANPESARVFNSADHLANHLAEVPVLIIATIRGGDTGTSPAGSYFYPAVQNLMLARPRDDTHHPPPRPRKRCQGAARHPRQCPDARAHPARLAERQVRHGRTPPGRRRHLLGEMGRNKLALSPLAALGVKTSAAACRCAAATSTSPLQYPPPSERRR